MLLHGSGLAHIPEIPSPKGFADLLRRKRIYERVEGDLHDDRFYERVEGERRNFAQERAAVAWTGGTSTLVLLGDVIDKGAQPFSIFVVIAILKEQAAKQGGRVELILGNHDMFRIAGRWEHAQQGPDQHVIDLFANEQIADRIAWTHYFLDETPEGFAKNFAEKESMKMSELQKGVSCAVHYKNARWHPAHRGQIRDLEPSHDAFPASLQTWLVENLQR